MDYPTPRQLGSAPYAVEKGKNPVLRGMILVISAAVLHRSTSISRFFWKNAGMGKIKEIPELEDYEATYDPTISSHMSNAPNSSTVTPLEPRPRANEKAYYTSADYHALYKSGELTPTRVVEALLPLIERNPSDPFKTKGEHSIAFTEPNFERALASAKASTARYMEGKPLGPFDGVPIVVKDQLDVSGYKTWFGSRVSFESKQGKTSWCIQKLEDAGAVVIGKTLMHEIGMDTTNNNLYWGTPRNPHNPNYYTGGSSGGSAYAISAGLVPFGHGGDGGGSIRIPSSFCGLYGLKTTQGRVSIGPTVDICPTVAVNGPMASNMDDLALAYRLMAEPDTEYQRSSRFPSPSLNPFASLPADRPKVIGVYRLWFDAAEAAVKKPCQAAIEHFAKNSGYTVVDDPKEFTLPYMNLGQKALVMTILAEVSTGLLPDARSKLNKLAPQQKILMALSQITSGQDLIAAQRLRSILLSHLAYLFKKYPGLIIVSPSTAVAGWKIQKGDLSHGLSDTDQSLRNMTYSWLANFTGCPAINIPVGYSEEKVPIGLMGMAEWGREEELLAFGKDGEGIPGEGGLRRPEKNWVDVVELAKVKKSE